MIPDLNPDNDDPIWSDDTAGDMLPFVYDANTIGIKESLSYDRPEADSCGCIVDGVEVPGTSSTEEGGDDGFTYWSLFASCKCTFQCHPA